MSVQFITRDNTLFVTIETPRLLIQSVPDTPEEIDRFADLFGNPEVMTKFGDGPKNREYIENRIKNVWRKRWDNGDPFSGFAVLDKETREFLGHVVLGHEDAPGVGALAGLGYPKFWNQGYGTEAIDAIVTKFAPATVKAGFLLNGLPLQTINATARPDNRASIALLTKVGMQHTKTVEEYGAVRHLYSIKI